MAGIKCSDSCHTSLTELNDINSRKSNKAYKSELTNLKAEAELKFSKKYRMHEKKNIKLVEHLSMK